MRFQLNWNDLKIVLSIARSGTLSEAATRLGVDQTTVGRRLSAIETNLGARLFLRSRSGLVATETAEELLDELERMETSALRIAERAGSVSQRPTGIVRIATMPWILSHLIAPQLPRFSAEYPDIEVQGLADLRERSLSRKEAELSLRFELPAHGNEIERPVGRFPYSIYIRKDLDPSRTPWAGTAIDFGRFVPQTWFENRIEGSDLKASFRSDDAGILYQAVRSGAVQSLLPDILGQSDPTLRKVSSDRPEVIRSLRLLVHPDVEQLSRVQVVIEWLETIFEEHRL